jgi:urea transport system permease protein
MFQGVSLSSILLLMALGLAIIFGLMGVINMAHGELMALGAYTTYVTQGWFQGHAAGLFDYYFLVALPLSFLVAGMAGFVLERGVIRFLYGRPLETLLLTWGISLMIQQGLRLWFGAANVDVISPTWLSGGVPVMVGIQLPFNRLFIIGLATVAVAGMYLLLFKTDGGLRIRAVTQNRGMAACLGVRSRRVDALTFALGAGLAGIAGCALTQIGNVGPELGQNYIVDSFMVVVTGGVGKLLGTILAALGIGGLNKIIEPAAGAVFGKVAILVLVILFIQRRPSGLFAAKGRYADS